MKKLFCFFGLLALVSSCTVEDGLCGNGKLDELEECDGSSFRDGICGRGYQLKSTAICSNECKIDSDQCIEKHEFVKSGIDECSSMITKEGKNITGEVSIITSKHIDDVEVNDKEFEVCMNCVDSVDISTFNEMNNFRMETDFKCSGRYGRTDNYNVKVHALDTEFNKESKYYCYIIVRGKMMDGKRDIYYCGNNVNAAPVSATEAIKDCMACSNNDETCLSNCPKKESGSPLFQLSFSAK